MEFNSKDRVVDRARKEDSALNQGLRQYFIKIYNYMALGLGFTGVISYFVAKSPTLATALNTGFMPLLLFIPMLFMAWTLPRKIATMSLPTAQLYFWSFCALMGASLSYIFLLYTGGSIARVFLITAANFGAMSLIGYTTKKDLSNLGAYLMMALIGLIIATVVNMFLQSPMMYYVVSWLGVLIFSALTAYDTQAIKDMYYAQDGQEITEKKAILGAFRLYLDLINMFLFLLRLFGERR